MPWIVGGIDRMLVFCAADRTGSGGLSHEFDACSGGCYHHNAGWSSLVARWAHNPKVGGSNPPPATNSIIGLQAKLLLPAGAKRGIQGCFGDLFHFASLSAGRSTI